MSSTTVTLRVPPRAAYLAVLRTTVGSVAARDRFTLDMVDDLRMAVEEAAAQLLRRCRGDVLTMDVSLTAVGVTVRLAAQVEGTEPVVDDSSFSWMILRALADDLEVGHEAGSAMVLLGKHRLAPEGDRSGGDAPGKTAAPGGGGS